MGLKQAKFVIPSEEQAPNKGEVAENADEAALQVEETSSPAVIENGQTPAAEAEGGINTVTVEAEQTNGAPATDEQEAPKTPKSHKKKSPMVWLQKKISIKKTKTPKKQSTDEAVKEIAETTTEEQHAPAVPEENGIPVVSSGDVQTTETAPVILSIDMSPMSVPQVPISNGHLDHGMQAEPIQILDQASGLENSDVAAHVECASELVNEVCTAAQVECEQIAEQPIDNGVEDFSSDLAKKMACLGMEEPAAEWSNGTGEDHVSNGHTEVAAEE